MKKLIAQVNSKDWFKKLDKLNNWWLSQPWDELWYKIVLIRLDPSYD